MLLIHLLLLYLLYLYSLLELKAGESLVRQQVDPGDAVTEIDGYGDSITIPVDNNLISSLKSNRVFTPNGDGINDVLNLNFDILSFDMLLR